MKADQGNKVLQVITECFIMAIVILFPLCVDSTGFFKILECKYRYFLIINAIYISVMVITILYFILFKKINLLKNIRLKKIHVFLLAYWFVNILATFLSPYFKKYNLFIGVGRAEGLITISLYAISFLGITLFGTFKRRYILYFSISSILVNLISILQYIGFNPLNMYQDGIGTHNVSFIGTIGNLDFVSTFYCITLTISMAAYIFLEDNKTYEKIIYLVATYMGFFIYEVLDVLSGTLAFVLILVITIPFIITNSKRLSRLLMITSMIVLGYFTNITINPTFYYSIGKIVLEFQVNSISIMLFGVSIIFILLSYLLSKRNFDLSTNKKIIKIFYIVIAICAIIALVGLYFINVGSGFLYEIHEILHGNFDDEFGTYRMFLWKRSINLIKDYPILGTGPDTFAVRFMDRYTNDVATIGELTINDTAANNYLTILVNIGVLGLIAYLLFISSLMVECLKNRNQYSMVFLITLLCFLIQDFFNLWVVIVIPIYWVLMSIMFLTFSSLNIKNTKEKEGKNEENS